ncbi:CHAT domain-containing tetratricopeptide repeat protein [Streptomyces griseoloalbus]|uniref:Tetratricopeptide (TPR) repeat protein n=1 Tax=Streptomyces griseoloalbus TaxID=67303 RepID=A0A7W8BP53_9ACTN|nr:CHAT domain-containing protein [Streptomyces albaduncus]MBB5126402.1 tetratricopeptide (TPR) repeat protein [Streptomyces albaduncus]
MFNASRARAADGPDEEAHADRLLLHHLRTGDRHALDQAIALYRRLLASAAPTAVRTAVRAANLMVALQTRYQLLRRPDDLDALVDLGRERAACEPVRPQDVRLLGLAYQQRFALHGRPDDLDRAVETFDRAARLPQDAETAAQSLGALGEVLRLRHEIAVDRGGARATGPPAGNTAAPVPTDLLRATDAQRRALHVLPGGSDDRPGYLGNLAAMRHDAYLFDGDLSALREAVDLWRAALEAVPRGEPARLLVLRNLAQALREWHEQAPEEAHRSEMLRIHRMALAECPQGHPDRASLLAGLGIALRLAAEATDEPTLLEESVASLREALTVSRPGTPERATRLNSLGNALHRLAQRTGDAVLLDEAVATLRTALAEQEPGTDPYAGTLANLAVTLRERALQTDDLTSLREASRLAREALHASQAPPAFQAVRLGNLGVVLQSWHGVTGDTAAADEAIDAARQALALAPGAGQSRVDRLNHLANALRARFGSTAHVADLDEAVELLEEAARQVPYGDPALALLLSNLGSARLTKHHATGKPGELEQAVSELGRAVWAVTEHTSTHGTYLRAYGDALRALYHRDGDPGVLRAAEDAYRQAAGTRSLPAYERVLAAWEWGAAAADGDRWDEALPGYELALELLPFAASGRLVRSDQERGLSRVRGLAAEAAACAVNAGQPERAVLLLEQGRGVLLGRTMATRDGLGRLRGAHPALAERFARLRQRLDALEAADAADTAQGLLPADTTDLRHTLAAELEHLVAEIRARPGFSDFLGAPAIEALLACADRGPVVLAYCSAYRSDALVLRNGEVLLVPLPHATPRAVAEQADRLERALADAADPTRDRAAQQTVGEVLAWTWDHVTGPVLGRLGLRGPTPDGEWHRLWWSPGGALASLPLHAAGHHGEAPDAVPDAGSVPAPVAAVPRTVLDRVVSSYTPTVAALRYARARAAAPRPHGPLLAVALPDTPGARPLGGARREVEVLRGLLPTEVLSEERATFERVMDALPRHPCVHFACHGVSEPADPSNGRLLVHDHATRPLTVREISRLELPAARLAVMSACETARGGGELADEAIHITSAFQLAGYAHAVGTLWPVHDAVAVRVTRLLYRELCTEGADGGPELDDTRTAHALHQAVLRCRAAFAASPSLWAAHVHAGA